MNKREQETCDNTITYLWQDYKINKNAIISICVKEDRFGGFDNGKIEIDKNKIPPGTELPNYKYGYEIVLI